MLLWLIGQNRNICVCNEANISARQAGAQAVSRWIEWATINGLIVAKTSTTIQHTVDHTSIKWLPLHKAT
jgi:hypothetical protein